MAVPYVNFISYDLGSDKFLEEVGYKWRKKFLKCRGNPRSAKPAYSDSPNAPKKMKNRPGTHRFSKIGRKITSRIKGKILQVVSGMAANKGASFRTPMLAKMAEHGQMLLSQRGKNARQIRRAGIKKGTIEVKRKGKRHRNRAI
ncbi:hypothetical protein AAMO2058_000848400 [Amorphochlora amoebiformis]